MASLAQYPVVEAQPGERFTYVFIPADSSKPLEERSESAEGGLEDDKLSKSLRAGTEVGPNIDITAVRNMGRVGAVHRCDFLGSPSHTEGHRTRSAEVPVPLFQ